MMAPMLCANVSRFYPMGSATYQICLQLSCAHSTQSISMGLASATIPSSIYQAPACPARRMLKRRALPPAGVKPVMSMSLVSALTV